MSYFVFPFLSADVSYWKVRVLIVFTILLFYLVGGAVALSLNMSSVYRFISLHREYNDFNILMEAFRQHLPLYATDKCYLHGYMTSSGSLSLVLEAIASGHSELCSRALDELNSAVTLTSVTPEFHFEMKEQLRHDANQWIGDIGHKFYIGVKDLPNFFKRSALQCSVNLCSILIFFCCLLVFTVIDT